METTTRQDTYIEIAIPATLVFRVKPAELATFDKPADDAALLEFVADLVGNSDTREAETDDVDLEFGSIEIDEFATPSPETDYRRQRLGPTRRVSVAWQGRGMSGHGYAAQFVERT